MSLSSIDKAPEEEDDVEEDEDPSTREEKASEEEEDEAEDNEEEEVKNEGTYNKQSNKCSDSINNNNQNKANTMP